MNSLVGRVMCNLGSPATRQSSPRGLRREEKQLGILQFQKSTYLPSYTQKKSNKDFKHSILQAEQKRKNVLLVLILPIKLSFHNFLLLMGT